jgi:putative polyhydroxyalkanoate system protein
MNGAPLRSIDIRALSETPVGVRVSKVTIRRAHSLSSREALRLAKSVAADIGEDYGVKCSWKGDTMELVGPGVRGTLQLNPKEMVLDLQLGIMLFVLRDSIVAQIERRFDQVLPPQSLKAEKRRSRLK